MIRLFVPLFALPLATLAMPAAAGAAMVGDVAACTSGQPSILVRLSGFKQVKGNVRFDLFREQGFLQRGGSLKRVRFPVTASTMDVCLATPGAGRYAVAVHHDLDSDRKRDRTDGGGFSRNPRLSIFSRPSFSGAQIDVGDGVKPIAIQLVYLRGLTVGPARSG